jgi:hypothetical protein
MKTDFLEQLSKKYFDFIEFEISDISERLNKLPSVVGYYQSIYFNLKPKHSKYSLEMDRKWKELYLYYKNEFNIVLNNNEIKQFIEKDLDYLDIKEKLKNVEDIMGSLEEIIKGLDNFRWTIKSLIDWEQFKAGK